MWRKRILWAFSIAACLWFAFCLPRTLFAPKYATVVFDKNGTLLGARTAADEQWRFPPSDSLPEKYKQAVLLFEDQWFHYHPGVNPIALAKALWQNVSAWKIKRGASTLTMQVIRLSRSNPPRTIWEKFLELFRAVRLEFRYTKDEIFELYAAHAPFGGNVVGVEAAAWRYFGQPLHQLSAAEYATLAVLPNAPSWIRPGKNAPLLLKRRNQLLLKMHRQGYIDTTSYTLACAEPLPENTYAIPKTAAHVVAKLHNENPGIRHYTTLDNSLQQAAEQLVLRFGLKNAENKIHNAGLIIAKVESGEVVAYVGNVPGLSHQHSPFVDVVQAPRSTGSTLKPFLYAASLQSGTIAPNTLLPDLPVVLGGFRPTNYAGTFDGAVAASNALSRSLNIPMVKLLQEYRVDPFLKICNQLGLKSLNKPADHYGLSLILGGGEVSLWELTGAYGALARQIQNPEKAVFPLKLTTNTSDIPLPAPFDSQCAWWTAAALRNVARPEEEDGWQLFSRPNIAWKTGTSFGFRDAWSVGFSKDYVVGVWVGNASGEGRPGLVGGQVAAPLLFQAFGLLPVSQWFENGYVDAKKVNVCSSSGAIAGENCPTSTITYWPEKALERNCSYHQKVWLNATKTHRVRRDCYTSKINPATYFVLPPAMAWYYRQQHAAYTDIPPWLPTCESQNENGIQVIYPEARAEVLLPRDRNGIVQEVVLKAAHQNQNETLYWDIDGYHQGITTVDHSIAVKLDPGKHLLTVFDQQGSKKQLPFYCL